MGQHQESSLVGRLNSKVTAEGFTIIESLLAILIGGLLLVGLAPVIVLSTGTRLQARRVELATQAVSGYMDAVNAGTVTLPTATGASLSAEPAAISTHALGCAVGTYCANTSTVSLYCAASNDGNNTCNNNSSQDFVVQAYRIQANSTTQTQGYTLLARVYRGDGFSGAGNLRRSNYDNVNNQYAQPNDKKFNKATQSAGAAAFNRKAPLLEISTDITPNTAGFKDLCARLKDPSNPNFGCLQ